MTESSRIVALVFAGLALGSIAPLRAGEIHDAAAAGDLDRVTALLAADATLLESKDNRGMTPLARACFGGPPSFNEQLEVALFLIDQGANVNAKENSGYTPLHRVIYSRGKNLALIRRLLEAGADVNASGSNGRTPLNSAAQSDNLDVARVLIAHGADLNAGNDYHGPINTGDIAGSILQVAIRYSPGEAMARLLVESGATPGQKDAFGNTEIHLAAMRGYADLVHLLIEHGADVHAVNDSGRTALDYAAKHGFRRVADLLIAAGTKQSESVEVNFGKAPQLTATLQDGEAYLWYLDSSPGGGYAVKTKNHLLLFNPPGPEGSLEAGLANGNLNPRELAGQKIISLLTWAWSGSSPELLGFFELARRMPVLALVSALPPAAASPGERDVPSYHLAAAHEHFSMGHVDVHVIPAMPNGWGGGGMGYLVEVDGLKILHAGFHATPSDSAEQVETYRREIDFLSPFGPIDIVILPVKSHINVAYQPYLYLLDQLSPKAIYLSGANQPEEHAICAHVLRARNIPVAYPEKGAGKGDRFHFLRERRSARPAPDASAADKRPSPFVCDYLNETPPGDEPVVFARGVVSVEGRNTHALAFSPDGRMLIFSRYPDRTSFVMVRAKEGWSQPERTSFTGKEVTFSPDGRRLFYYFCGDLFAVRLEAGRFSAPIELGPEVNTREVEYYPSITARGNLFFSRNSNWDEGRIEVAMTKGDGFGEAVDLGDIVNEGGASHGFIAPDEGYLLFNSPRPGSTTKNDIWVSLRGADGAWQAPVNLGPRINRDAMAVLCPTVSPDGKYLFFTRLQESGTGLVYWVSTANLPVLGVHQ